MRVDYSRKIYLIVDDFYEFRRSVKQMLTELGAKDIESVGDAEKALGLARRKHFDVIICDYNLGESKDGQELHEQLVAEGAIDSSTAFLMVTAEDTTAMVLASLECEPDAYLTKPFSKPVLTSRLERVLLKKDLLADAIRISPKSVPRNITLAELAAQNNDMATAVKAWRSALRYGRHSLHKCPEAYLNLARDLGAFMGEDKSLNSRLVNEAVQALESARRGFPDDRETEVRAGFIGADIADRQGDETAAGTYRRAALEAAEKIQIFRLDSLHARLHAPECVASLGIPGHRTCRQRVRLPAIDDRGRRAVSSRREFFHRQHRARIVLCGPGVQAAPTS